MKWKKLRKCIQYLNPNQHVSGVYKITSTTSGHYYYGSSKLIEKRCFSDHFTNLKNNTHCNRYMQNVYNKYRNGWLIEVIEFSNPDDKSLEQAEQPYLNEHYGKPLCMNNSPSASRNPANLFPCKKPTKEEYKLRAIKANATRNAKRYKICMGRIKAAKLVRTKVTYSF